MKIESKDIERMETAKIIIAKMETDKVYSSHAIQNMFKLNTKEENLKCLLSMVKEEVQTQLQLF